MTPLSAQGDKVIQGYGSKDCLNLSPSIVVFRSMTLIEIVIVLAVLSMVIGVVGFNLANMAQQERFRAGSTFLVDRLQLAQDIMILFETDVKAILTKQENTLGFRLELDSSRIQGTALEGVIRPINIPGITAFTFTDARGVSQADRIELLFMSRGTKMSRGTLMLTGAPGNEDLTRYITLSGYPRVIRYASEPEQDDLIPNLSEQLYPVEVTQYEQKQNASP